MNLPRATLIAAFVLSLSTLGVAAGCAPSLSGMQPAHVAPKHHFQATAAVEVGVPTGTIGEIIDTGRTLADAATNQRDLTPEEEQRVFKSGIVVGSSPPSFGYHYALAYSPLDNWEVSLRWAGDGYRIGTRYQLLHREDGPFDMTIGAGVARSVFEIPLADYIPILEVEDFTRWTFDVPLLIGTSRKYYRAWGGPKFLYSRFDMAMQLAIPYVDATDLASFEGHAYYFGGQVGAAFGWRWVFFAVELTMARVVGTAYVQTQSPPRTTAPNPEPIARNVDISGFIVYPTVGFIGEF